MEYFMEPLISVIVPVYNTELYLRQCIESICVQTYRNLEVILVDDGSTDASGTICDEYAGKDPRIKVLHKENGGVTSARKAGIALARGIFTGFVDSDDWIEPDMYEALSKKMGECGADMVWSNAHWHKGEVAVLRHTSISEGLYRSNQNFIDLMDNIIYSGRPEDSMVLPALWNKLFKTELIRNAIYAVDDAVTIGEDHLVLCIAAMRSEAVYVMQESFYHYRIHPVSALRQSHRDYFLTLHYFYNGFRAAIEKFPQYQNTLSEQLAHLMVRYLLDGINARFEWGFGMKVRVPQYLLPVNALGGVSSIVLCGGVMSGSVIMGK